MGLEVKPSPYVSGNSVQVVNFQTGEVGTGSTIIPGDDTIPQKTEGNEYMTLSITPKRATNKLLIEAVVNLAHIGADATCAAALFQDDVANALAAGRAGKNASANKASQVIVRHFMIAGTTNLTTFKIRAGSSTAGTTTFNGHTLGRIYGGVMASSITITEIKV